MTVARICSHCQHPYIGKRCGCRPARSKPRTEANRIRNTMAWRRVRARAIARDGNRCTWGLEDGDDGTLHYPDQRCPVTARLDGHHRVPIEAGGAPFALSNIRTMCSTHHNRAEASLRRQEQR